MDSTKIDRINTLHHKAQSVGLTEEEKKEQAELRKEYIATIKMNLRNQLDNIDVKEADGTVVRLIRKQIFAARKQCSDAQVEEWSHQITDQVLKLSEFVKAKHILAYADYNHEVMTRYIIEEAWKAGKEVAVPKVVGKDMIFYRLTDFSQLEPGYFGIPEPVRGEIVKWEDALMVMPGVAFDPENNRVGYGGGFYDRFLEKHPDITRLAVAFDFQILDLVPTEPTDICPQIIVTQSKVYRREDL